MRRCIEELNRQHFMVDCCFLFVSRIVLAKFLGGCIGNVTTIYYLFDIHYELCT